jgi:hypothetical protein
MNGWVDHREGLDVSERKTYFFAGIGIPHLQFVA